MSFNRSAKGILALVGVCLIALASTQLLARQTLGDPTGVPGWHYIGGRTLAQIPASELPRRPRESTLGYANRVALTVHLSTYQCEPDDFSLTPLETVISKLLQMVGMRFDWHLGLFQKSTLRCGACHQRAIAAANILRENGLNAWAFGNGGHVLVKFAANEHIYLVDPDYGAVAYRYDVPSGDLKKEIDLVYADTGWNNAEVIFGIVSAEKAMAVSYFTPQYFIDLKRNRNFVFFGADAIAIAFAILGLLLITKQVVHRLRSRRRRDADIELAFESHSRGHVGTAAGHPLDRTALK